MNSRIVTINETKSASAIRDIAVVIATTVPVKMQHRERLRRVIMIIIRRMNNNKINNKKVRNNIFWTFIYIYNGF